MNADKIKQYIALFGGLLSTIYLFLDSIGVAPKWFTPKVINSFTDMLLAAVPFILIGYGVWKNSYIVTKKAKEQEKCLKDKGLK